MFLAARVKKKMFVLFKLWEGQRSSPSRDKLSQMPGSVNSRCTGSGECHSLHSIAILTTEKLGVGALDEGIRAHNMF